jgi:hypothetical protein
MRTIPDYGVSQSQLGSPDIDSAELAARLGGVDSFRRSGRVVFIDDCQSVAPWLQDGSTGFNVAVDSTYSYQGNGSLKLTPGTSPPATYDVRISKTFPALSPVPLTNLNSKIGIDFYFSAEYIESGSPAFMELELRLDPVQYLYACYLRLRFNMGDGSLEYFNGITDVYFPFPVQSVYGTFKYGESRYGPYALPYNRYAGATWHNIKAVMSFGFYWTLFFDGVEIPLNLPVAIIPTLGLSTSAVGFHWRDIDGSRLWLDNIIITMDEP